MSFRPGSSIPAPVLTPPRIHLARDVTPALAAGQVRHGAWERVDRGVYVPTALSLSTRQHALARIAGIDEYLRRPHWFSHESAALLWGLPLWRCPAVVHVRQEGHASAQRSRSVVRHRGIVDATRLTVVGRLPVTDLVQTMVDCARSLPPLAGLVVADAALRAGADRTEALAMLDELRGRNGAARARAVVELADDGAESPGETATRFVLLREGLPRPETQIEVATSDGTFWADIGWEKWRSLVEYDGRSKYVDVEDLVREKRREDLVREVGYRMQRVLKEDLRADAALVAKVTRMLPPGIPRTPRPLLRG